MRNYSAHTGLSIGNSLEWRREREAAERFAVPSDLDVAWSLLRQLESPPVIFGEVFVPRFDELAVARAFLRAVQPAAKAPERGARHAA